MVFFILREILGLAPAIPDARGRELSVELLAGEIANKRGGAGMGAGNQHIPAQLAIWTTSLPLSPLFLRDSDLFYSFVASRIYSP